MSLKKYTHNLLAGSCIIVATVGCQSNGNSLRPRLPSFAKASWGAVEPESVKAGTLESDALKASPPGSTAPVVSGTRPEIDLVGLETISRDAEADLELREIAQVDALELHDAANESLQNAFEQEQSTIFGDDRRTNVTSLKPPQQSPSGNHAPNELPRSTVGMLGTNLDRSGRPRDANSLPDQFRVLSESEMLSIAFNNAPVLRSLGVRILESPSAASTVYDTAIKASDPFFGPDAALAAFDTNLQASLNAQNNDRVFNNSTLGGQVQELTQDFVQYNTGALKRTMTGATLDVGSQLIYDNNNRAGNSFRNYYETQFSVGVRQPLLRGAGKEYNRIAGPNAQPGFNFSNGIVIARMNNRISEADFEITLRDYVRDLYSAYWDLVRNYHSYKSVLQARELAYRTWQTVRAKAEANLEGGEANKEAQARAKYYNYRREVQVALGGASGRGGLYVAERKLRQLMGLPVVDGELLTPADSPVTARFVFDYDLLVSRAMTGRTELTRQSIKVQQQRLRVLAAKNFLLPQMDVIGRYRLRGFGDDLTGGNGRFSSAYDDFASLDHQEWEFGIEMGVVAGRRQARAAVRNAQFQFSREQNILQEQQRVVRHQVSDAHAEVSSAYYAMESSMRQVEAARARLDSSEALFRADKLEIEFLLDAQEELLRAELQLSSDLARYSISLVEVNNTAGTLLSDIGIRVSNSKCGTHVQYMSSEPFGANNTAQLNRQSVVVPQLNDVLPTPDYDSVEPEPIPESMPDAPAHMGTGEDARHRSASRPVKMLPASLPAPVPTIMASQISSRNMIAPLPIQNPVIQLDRPRPKPPAPQPAQETEDRAVAEPAVESAATSKTAVETLADADPAWPAGLAPHEPMYTPTPAIAPKPATTQLGRPKLSGPQGNVSIDSPAKPNVIAEGVRVSLPGVVDNPFFR